MMPQRRSQITGTEDFRVICVVGARPSFMKIAPLLRVFGRSERLQPLLMHTGQHYDVEMNEALFKDIGIPRLDVELGVGSGTQASQAADLTDSGEIQEETTALRVPCLTLREHTERPVTVEQGTNILVGRSVRHWLVEVDALLAGKRSPGVVPELWEGRAAERVASALEDLD